MNFLNLGIGEVIFIIIIALIIFGPGNMVKTAREIGVFIRKVTKSPYWQEVWATRRELTELPKMIAKEAKLDETIRDLNKDTKGIQSSVAASISDFIKEVDSPLKEMDKQLKETPAVNLNPEKSAVVESPDVDPKPVEIPGEEKGN
jgi:Sec-independent protein translocase protein TatA